MGNLVRIGNAAFDLDKVVGVEGDRVVFADGKVLPVSKKTKEALLDAIGKREKSRKGLRQGGEA